MRLKVLRYSLLAVVLIAIPPLADSCLCPCGCFGNGGGPPHLDIGEMSIYVDGRRTSGATSQPPFKLSDVWFAVFLSGKFAYLRASVGGAVYACSPAPPIVNQRITSIVITSNSDLIGSPATFPAGVDLAAIFEVSPWNGASSTIPEFLNKEFEGDRIDFHAKAQADSRQSHVFTFRITLDDGQVFELVTETVELIAG